MRSSPSAGPRSLGAVLVVLACGSAGIAQHAVPQDGRLFDANPSLTGPYNAARPASPLLTGNATATGNISGGFGLRSFAPIGNPNSFRAPLGSAALSDFRRDSFSVAESLSPYRGLLARPYFDPDTTAPTAGFLQGQGPAYRGFVAPRPLPLPGAGGAFEPNVLPGPLPGSAPLDLRLNPRLNSTQALRTQITGIAPQSRGELGSSLFGPPTLRRSPAEQALAAVQSPVVDLAPRPWRPAPTDAAPGARDVPRLPGTSDPLGTPLDVALRGDTSALLLGPPGLTRGPRVEGDTSVPLKPGVLEALRHQTAVEENLIVPARTPKLVDHSVLPGREVFTDMRLALALQRDPAADWFDAMRDAIRDDPTLAAELQEVAQLQADQFVDRVLKSEVKTFVGRSPTAVNNELLKAESLMETGQYFDAAKRYEQAQLLDPGNPLPLIGRAHALLAAGEYQTAAVNLERGLERFPEMARIRVALSDLMGGGEVVDIRRADILSRLAAREDAQLRFLLGYIEYYTGSEARGLENLRRAAAAAPAGSIIARFPGMLSGDAVLPPPKLPEITVPEAPQPRSIAPDEAPAPRAVPIMPAKEPR